MALSAALTTEINKAITAPVFLIQIDFSSSVYYSTRNDVTWNSQTWIDVGVAVQRISLDSINGRSARVAFQNADNAASTLILAQGIRDTRIQIWQAYGASDTIPLDQATQIFDGYLAESPRISTEVVIVAYALPEQVLQSPRFRIAEPICKHLPLPGKKIKWNGDNYTLMRSY